LESWGMGVSSGMCEGPLAIGAQQRAMRKRVTSD
jgi:hypothetical protein